MNKIYDCIIIGGGPAGYSAALYCTRSGFKTLVIEQFSAGGQMILTSEIDNYPGFNEGISGFDLANNMKLGADKFGAETVSEEVLDIELKNKTKIIKTKNNSFEAKTVIIATGAAPRRLGIENEDSFVGKGLSYCATCDGMFYRNKTVVVVGGGNSAAEDAIILSRLCKKVILMHRRDKLRATKYYSDLLSKSENVEFIWNAEIVEILTDELVKGVIYKDKITDKTNEIACEGVFVAIGRIPNTKIFEGILNLSDNGYIVADETTKTNVPGIFAAGDVRTKPLRQVITAASDGAVASKFVEEYINL